MASDRREPDSTGLLWLGEPACGDARVAGGKGASLSRLVAAGLPVPLGFVVGAAAFRRFVATEAVDRDVATRLAALDVADAEGLARASRHIRARIRSIPLPDDLTRALAAACALLGGPVAVRSSAIAEDSGAASYAGQQETYLGVGGVDEVIARVRDCWASFFSEHAIFYRGQKGSLADVGIAVVVQRLIVPEKAGVLFTVDPVQGRRDRLVIEAVWGFGEALASGQVTPDNYQVARRDGQVLRAFVPTKRVAFAPASQQSDRPDRGGLVQVEVPESRRDARVLDDEEIGRLAALGLRLEELFGAPQDVEWGIAEGTIYLLQSRPITTPGVPGGRGR